ncbi:MAG: NosD domain-containing protein, partial [Candidatus Hodarchaeales archaeon]
MRPSQILVAILFASLVIEPIEMSKFSSGNGKLAIPRLIEDVAQNPEIKHDFPVDYSSNEKFENSLNANITGRYWDYGNDTDEDGKFNHLIILVEIIITYEWTYNITVDLKSSTSYYSWQESISGNWSIGFQNVSLSLNVAEIYSEKLTTSFTIVSSQITMDSIFIDDDYPNYTTQIYAYSDFDPPKVYYTGESFLSTWDGNSNGYLDEFDFHARFTVTVEGYYSLNLSYHTTADNYSSWVITSQRFYLMSGSNIPFILRPELLYIREVNTTYSFDSIHIKDEDGVSLGKVTINYVTRVYDYTEFEPHAVYPTGRFWDFGVDTDSNGKINSLAIITELDILHPGGFIGITLWYDLTLDLSFGNLSRSATETISISQSGLLNRTFLFDTTTYYSHFAFSEKVSDIFSISRIRVMDQFSELVYEKDITYFTSEYYFDDFDRPLIAIEGSESFAYFANLEGWQGTGTENDPYVIEGLTLNGTSFSFPIIEIRNSQDYFSIRNCIFLGADIGIKLISAENADISENTFLDTGLGIEVRYSLNINIKDNLFQSEEGTGIRIEQAENITISNNKIKDADEGIIFENAKDMIIDNNSISSSNSWIGINFEEVDYSNITRNRINGFNYGIFLDACIYVNIRMNIIYENGHGIHIGGSLPYPPYSSRWNNLSLNLICDNDEYAISLDNLATFDTILKNTFTTANQFFILDSGKNNSFTQNYW